MLCKHKFGMLHLIRITFSSFREKEMDFPQSTRKASSARATEKEVTG